MTQRNCTALGQKKPADQAGSGLPSGIPGLPKAVQADTPAEEAGWWLRTA